MNPVKSPIYGRYYRSTATHRRDMTIKADVSEPLAYAFVVGILLLVRAVAAVYARRTIMLEDLKSA
jgi:hypothetical protein